MNSRFTSFLASVFGLVCLAMPAFAQSETANDPLEPFNRVVFGANRVLDHVILRPTAEAYRYVLPGEIRDHLHNAFTNLNNPISFVNLLLQARFYDAGVTAARFVANSTIGIGGLFDVTGSQDEDKQADFGQTLGSWGVDSGPYLVLPLFGPSTVRDTVGRVVDTFGDPVYYYVHYDDETFPHPNTAMLILDGASAVDTRSRIIRQIDDLERNSLDFYASVRSIYLQRRAAKISGEGLPSAATPVM